jgi:alpha-ribazole phosphatase
MGFSTLTIDLLRHGEPEGGPMYRGSTDKILTTEGWEQMEQAIKLPPSMTPPWTQVVYSPLLRCCEFALKVSQRYEIPCVEYADLRELHFGDWEGRSFEEVGRYDKAAVQAFWSDPVKNMPPKGESITQLHTRVIGVWNLLVQQHQSELTQSIDKHLLLVAHGGVIRSILCHVLGMPLESIQRITIPYACLSQVKIFCGDKGDCWQQLVFHQGSYLNFTLQQNPFSG